MAVFTALSMLAKLMALSEKLKWPRNIFYKTFVYHMCDICEKHTKGLKWYLNPDFYRDELVLKDPQRHKVVEDITGYRLEYYVYNASKMAKLVSKMSQPLKAIFKAIANKAAYSLHAGQVVPLEDALKIADIAHNHVVIPCYCRKLLAGKTEMTCLNFGLVKEMWPKYRPDDPVIELTREEAKRMLEEWDEKEYVHAVFWAKLPYVIAICNCEKKYCTAMRNRLLYGIENSFKKSHYVAVIDEELCDTCGGRPKCVTRCQFGALKYKPSEGKVVVDLSLCFGCGLCVSACDRGAIKLVEREKVGIRTY